METPTVPNTARILDYWLGGSHHFPVDIEGAKMFEAVYDGFPAVFRALRAYIGRAARSIESQGVDQFIVFGSGLPTQGNVHQAVPQSRVLYTDIDQANIRLGQQILADEPRADYTFCDAADLSTLDQQAVAQVLGPIRRLGVVFVGVAAFIPDEALAHMFDQIYAWVPEGSLMALDFDGTALGHLSEAIDMLDSMGAHLYMRTPATILPLLGRWRLTPPGIRPVDDWYPDRTGAPSDEPAFMYGCVVAK